MDTKYDHKRYEGEIYKLWERDKSFEPKPARKKFSIVLPPPNANAPLHYGHAMYTIEDILIRWHRMIGDETLWLPGSDHAGFETQVVYEKFLEKEGKSRFDFDRETLYENIWDFVQNNKGTMENQLKKLGFSLDWTRKKFTLDDDIVKTVYSTFKKLSDAKLIYRDDRLVNYCTKHGTAFSDLEVEHVEKEDELYYVEFLIKGEKDKITVATVRPETIYGDVAIAVNPKDNRYKKYVGKIVINPLNDIEMPIIADSYVKMDFGTGVLKITPAHDENDFALAKKYNFPLIQVIEFNGKMNSKAVDVEGLKVLPARKRVVEILESKNLLLKTEKYNHTVATCYKCGKTLEPLPLPQWYLKTKALAIPAIKVVKDGKIKIIPKRFEKIYFHWMNNIHDWNISRQVVWGIRIPAWKCQDCLKWEITDGSTPKDCGSCGSSNLIQDSDTFDTWFSSGQWPFATLDKKFYPVDVMETGYDILFFWVARMVMLGLFATNKIPFKNVYLHGMIRDPKGQKMSKSKGNVVNPLDVLDKYGADALRISLVAGVGPGNDQNYSESKVVGFRNFSNKIWNAGRFIKDFENNVYDDKEFDNFYTKELPLKITKLLQKYKIGLAAEELYNDFWHKFCDIEIERAKKGELSSRQLKTAFLVLLKLLHPFVPFITEAVWHEIGEKELLITSLWPVKVR